MAKEVREIIERVKVLREIEELSAEKLAEELGFDPGEYRKWEAGETDFPVGALVEIAARFRVDLPELISGRTPKLKTFCLTRGDSAPEVSRRPMYTYWNLAYHFHRKKAEPFLVEAKADTETKPLSLNTHPGQEFDYVLEGRLLISVGGREMELGPGDCIYYDSNEPHGMKAVGGQRTRFLAFVF
ncbi:MAG: XRE family transcriptional regulator [Spirochaetaceae bacterium]|jgi:transcriptional regulator with XRE-family HTH domain|nr:XRE family transcriptional regulator [Spirochaetaceae bacterium]